LTVSNSSGATLNINTAGGATDAKILLHETATATSEYGASLKYSGAFNRFEIGVGQDPETKRLSIDRDTGDISFYEDTGSTAKFHWDAADERLGIGTSTPSSQLHLSNAGGTTIKLGTSLNTSEIEARESGGANLLVLSSNNSADHMVINGNGNVGVGTSSPSTKLHVNTGAAGYGLTIAANTQTSLTYQMGIDSSSNFAIYDSFAASQRMVIDTSGNVGIGTSSPDTLLNLAGDETAVIRLENTNGSASDGDVIGALQFYKADGSGAGAGVVGQIKMLTQGVGSGGHLTLSTGDSSGNDVERMRITSNGNVGIGTGTSSPATQTHIQGSNAVTASAGLLYITANSAAQNNGGQISLGTSSARHAAIAGRQESTGGSAGYLQLSTRGSSGDITERLRIDSSGNLLVNRTGTSGLGKLNVEGGADFTGGDVYLCRDSGNVLVGTTSESTWETAKGFRARNSGSTTITRDGNPPLYVNRLNSDGTLLQFQKGTAVVGSIGVNNGTNFYIGAQGQTGLKFGSTDIVPADSNNSGASSDADMNLGNSSTRFKDLYLSGGVYLGGTGSANHLDDYEEGTWSPVYAPASGAFASITMDDQECAYVKIGSLVSVSGIIRTDAVDITGGSGLLRITGLPFTATRWSAANIGRITGFAGQTPLTGYVGGNSSFVILYYRTAVDGPTIGSDVTDLTTGTNDNANYMFFQCTYSTQ